MTALGHFFRTYGPGQFYLMFLINVAQWYYGRRLYRLWCRTRDELAWVYAHRLVVTRRVEDPTAAEYIKAHTDRPLVGLDVWMAVAGAEYEQEPGVPLVQGDVAVWFLQPDDAPLVRLPLPRAWPGAKPPAPRGRLPAD